MGEAVRIRDFHDKRLKADAAVATGEIWQMPDGQAAYYNALDAAAINDFTAWRTEGVVEVPKTANIVFLDGGRVYWDHSANKAHFKKVNDRDFYLGRAVGDAASADTTMKVDLNTDPPYDIDALRHGGLSVPVGTQVVGAFGHVKWLGGVASLEVTATNEAQKIDLLSVDGFAPGANPIVELVFRVPDDGAGTVVDVSLGVANGTHATDADAITEHLFAHLDANNTNINLQSKDGTTTVAAVDTTKDYVEGSNVANRVEVWFDMRNPADIQCYVEGVLVNAATVFRLDNAVGPLFLLAHLEKSLSTDVYRIVVDALRARFMQQDSAQK